MNFTEQTVYKVNESTLEVSQYHDETRLTWLGGNTLVLTKNEANALMRILAKLQGYTVVKD